MSASKSDLLAGINSTLASGSFPFIPVLDGPGGILSDSPAKRLSHRTGGRVPFMIGTVLDEGPFNPSTLTLSVLMPAQERSLFHGTFRAKIFPFDSLLVLPHVRLALVS